MLTIKAIRGGQTLNLSNNVNYALISAAGVTPPKAEVNTSPLATKDGSLFNSSRLQNRNIVLTVCPVGNVEQARLGLYSFFKAKQAVQLELKTASRDVVIDGWVESVNGDLFSPRQAIQISIICPDPYFRDKDETVVNYSSQAATLVNGSDDAVGFVTEFTASGAVEGVTLVNSTNGQSFAVSVTLASGDKLILNTKRGEKSVKKVHNGTETSVINLMDVNSDWVQLEVGSNSLSFSCTSGAANLSAKSVLQQIYEGV